MWSLIKFIIMKRIYGIDLSKEKFDVNFINTSGIIRHSIINNKFSCICKFLDKVPQGAILVAEHTGIYGELLVFLANQMNIFIALCSGYSIKHSLGLLKGKSDKLDAARIREFGERFTDKLKETICNSEIIAELNELYSLRTQLVKERKMLLTHSEKKPQAVSNSIAVNNIAMRMLKSFNESISEVEREIMTIIDLDVELKKNFDLATSVKGIGPITACELIIKTGNFKKINSAKKAASYAGVCPFPNSSGKMVKKSKVSPMSDKSLKTLLFLCAKSAIKHNKEFKLYYEKKKLEGKHHFIIMNNVSNKLLRTVFRIIETGIPWDPSYICLDPRETIKKIE